jgi:hypothetical protein
VSARRATTAGTVGVLLAALVTAGVGAAPATARAKAGPVAPTTTKTAPAPKFVAVDVAARAGIAATSTTTWSAAPFDYDRDGRQDVLIGYHPVKKLWRNKGDGTYEQVPANAWQRTGTDRHNCAWADVNRNGRPDVYCSAGRGLKNRVKHAGIDNELWLQGRDGEFSEVGTAWRAGDRCGRGRSVAFIRANADAYPDLFVGNQRPRGIKDDPCDSAPNSEHSKILINKGGAGFRHAPRFFPYGAGHGARCAEVLDFDGDGWEDLFTCRSFKNSGRLFRNKRGKGFRDVTSRHGLAERINDAAVGDLDGDGDPDLVTASHTGFSVHINEDGRLGPRRLISRVSVGAGVAVALGDADGDGDLDVYAMVGNGAKGNPDDRILINSRLAFRAVRVPSASGAADDVVPVNRLATRKVDFLVLNGYNLQGEGPVQLVRLFRR